MAHYSTRNLANQILYRIPSHLNTYFDKILHLRFDSMLNFIKDDCFHTIHSNVQFAVDF